MKSVKIANSKGEIVREITGEIPAMIKLNPGEHIVYNGPITVKIHFEIPQELWNRASRYITNYRMRHEYARIAFEEYINRREGRDKRLQAEKLKADAGYIQDMIDKGLVKLPEVKS